MYRLYQTMLNLSVQIVPSQMLWDWKIVMERTTNKMSFYRRKREIGDWSCPYESLERCHENRSINTPQLTFSFEDNCCSAVLRRHGKYLVQRENVNVNWSINCYLSLDRRWNSDVKDWKDVCYARPMLRSFTKCQPGRGISKITWYNSIVYIINHDFRHSTR